MALWRKLNNISQKEIATALNVSRSYVSQVETGTNNLSDEKIDFLMFEYGKNLQNPYTLVPNFEKLITLQQYLNNKGKIENTTSIIMPLSEILDEYTIKNIRHGKIPITDTVANNIKKHYPLVNKEWLMYGKGEIFVDNSIEELRAKINEQSTIINEINNKLTKISKALDHISTT